MNFSLIYIFLQIKSILAANVFSYILKEKNFQSIIFKKLFSYIQINFHKNKREKKNTRME